VRGLARGSRLPEPTGSRPWPARPAVAGRAKRPPGLGPRL